MGLLEKLGMGGGPLAKIARLQKKAMEKFGPPENRQGAIEELGELKSESAVDALLMRFTIRVDPGITDDEEKARTRALIVEVARKAAAEYSRVPEKKVLLLHAFAQHKAKEITAAVLPFLEDMNDEV